MTWTTEEIVRSYHEAANPEKQIKVLAELNACSTAKIREILVEAGEQVQEPKKSAGNGRRRFDGDAARELYDAGKDDDEIALALGASPTTVASWRSRNDLHKNGKRKRRVKPVHENNANAAGEAEELPLGLAYGEPAPLTRGAKGVTQEGGPGTPDVKRPRFTMVPREETKQFSEDMAAPKGSVTVSDLYRLLHEAKERGFGECRLLVKGYSFTEMWLNVRTEIRVENNSETVVELEASTAE